MYGFIGMPVGLIEGRFWTSSQRPAPDGARFPLSRRTGGGVLTCADVLGWWDLFLHIYHASPHITVGIPIMQGTAMASLGWRQPFASG
jgi:hypothetical protein